MEREIFVPHSEAERKNVIALAEYLGSIYYC
ncbi:MAG: hypothetical protein HLUCCX14_09365 [Marinobacter excellens HL-55]|uniref:Uncharacterized protein n=1 Tax=Marinobacter excellens HL-55 TaxID=1305731 RepID=A0A0P7Z9H7_9GAMM|nr:MAG: hypothetical protein HLUCCX14_09365 [Marinobacter excellens HL-55]